MALQAFDASTFLRRSASIVSGHPFVISIWMNRNSTDVRSKFYVQLGTTANNQGIAVMGTYPTAAPPPGYLGSHDGTTGVFVDSGPSNLSAATWYHLGGEFISNSSRAVLLNGGSRKTVATSNSPAATTQATIGGYYGSAAGNVSEFMGVDDGVAEISIWDGTGMSTGAAGDMDTLLGKLYNGGAAGAGGNPININAESSQPWTGKLRAYWTLTNTSTLTDSSGNGHTLTMTGTLANYSGSGGSHPIIETVGGPPVASHTMGIRVFNTVP